MIDLEEARTNDIEMEDVEKTARLINFQTRLVEQSGGALGGSRPGKFDFIQSREPISDRISNYMGA